MKIIEHNVYRDGGSQSILTDDGFFFWKTQSPFADKNNDRVLDNFPSDGGKIVPPELEAKVKDIINAYHYGFDEGCKYCKITQK